MRDGESLVVTATAEKQSPATLQPKPEPRTAETQPAGPPRIRQIVETDGTVRYVSQ